MSAHTLGRASTATQWMRLAEEAIADAGEWKSLTRRVQSEIQMVRDRNRLQASLIDEAMSALRDMLREHDALVMATNGTGDRWPAATRARAAIAKVQS